MSRTHGRNHTARHTRRRRPSESTVDVLIVLAWCASVAFVVTGLVAPHLVYIPGLP